MCSTLDALRAVSDTALTRETAIAMQADGLPNTFVPGRNLIFLTFAAALAYRRGLKHIVTGVCETDYSGYPDCRDDTLKALQVALNLGMERALRAAHAADVARQGGDLGAGGALGGAGAGRARSVEDTHSCYLGDRSTGTPGAIGCGTCPACDLRAAAGGLAGTSGDRDHDDTWTAPAARASSSSPFSASASRRPTG